MMELISSIEVTYFGDCVLRVNVFWYTVRKVKWGQIYTKCSTRSGMRGQNDPEDAEVNSVPKYNSDTILLITVVNGWVDIQWWFISYVNCFVSAYTLQSFSQDCHLQYRSFQWVWNRYQWKLLTALHEWSLLLPD